MGGREESQKWIAFLDPTTSGRKGMKMSLIFSLCFVAFWGGKEIGGGAEAVTIGREAEKKKKKGEEKRKSLSNNNKNKAFALFDARRKRKGRSGRLLLHKLSFCSPVRNGEKRKQKDMLKACPLGEERKSSSLSMHSIPILRRKAGMWDQKGRKGCLR